MAARRRRPCGAGAGGGRGGGAAGPPREGSMNNLLTVRQVAERLQVSVGIIYCLCAQSRLPHVRIGVGRGTIRIDEQALEAFIQGATVQPKEPAAPLPHSSVTPGATGASRQFRHVQWTRLPDSPPDATGRY